jgi:hypothetical protein
MAASVTSVDVCVSRPCGVAMSCRLFHSRDDAVPRIVIAIWWHWSVE